MEREVIDASFALADEDGYKKYFESHGVVVVRDVLSPEALEATLQEMWGAPALLGDTGVVRDDPETWKKWPLEAHGFLDLRPGHVEAELSQIWSNRQNPNVVRIFQTLLQHTELRLLQRDRLSMMPPTRDEKRSHEFPERRTKGGWLHWDQNPWSRPGFMGVQGLIALTDHTLTSGGFLCVPDFCGQFERWAEENPPQTPDMRGRTLVRVPLEDPVQSRARKVLAPAGSVIVWDSRTPHCNYPNDDHTFRACQYVSYEPIDVAGGDTLETSNSNSDKSTPIRVELNRAKPGMPFPACLTLLGQKVHELVPWSAADALPVESLGPNISVEMQEAWNLIGQAEALESQGRYNEAITCYKKARRISPEVCDEHGV